MTVEVRIWPEKHWAAQREDWQGALGKLADQVELALQDAAEVNPNLGPNASDDDADNSDEKDEGIDVKVALPQTDHDVPMPELPYPETLYAWALPETDGAPNLFYWDNFLNEHGHIYAEDATMLVMDDWGGVTFGSGTNWWTTSPGVNSLVGGQDIEADNPVQTSGPDGHYHNCYNALHELSHQLAAKTFWGALGRVYEGEDGEWHRTPTHTSWDVDATYDRRDGVAYDHVDDEYPWWIEPEDDEEFYDDLEACEGAWHNPGWWEIPHVTQWDLRYTQCSPLTMDDTEPRRDIPEDERPPLT